MSSPIDIAIRQQNALADATWSPLPGVSGVEVAQVDDLHVVRAISGDRALWYTPDEWARYTAGDQDMLVVIGDLAR